MNWGLDKSIVSMLNFLVLIVVLMEENVFVLRKYVLKYSKVKGHDVLQLNSRIVQKQHTCMYVYMYVCMLYACMLIGGAERR